MPHTISAVDMFGKRYRVSDDRLSWRPSAYAIVIKDDHLLVCSVLKRGYDLPGGGLELHETTEMAVIREAKEETGIAVQNPRLVGYTETFFVPDDQPASNPAAQHSLMFYYLCDYLGGEFSTAGFDEWEQQHFGEPKWYPLDKLDDLKVASSVDYRKYVKRALNMRNNSQHENHRH